MIYAELAITSARSDAFSPVHTLGSANALAFLSRSVEQLMSLSSSLRLWLDVLISHIRADLSRWRHRNMRSAGPRGRKQKQTMSLNMDVCLNAALDWVMDPSHGGRDAKRLLKRNNAAL